MTNNTLKPMTKDTLEAYAGKNGEYYSQFLSRYQQAPYFLSWNWSAFFCLPYWLAYRKLWKSLLVITGLQCFIMVLATNAFTSFSKRTYGVDPEFQMLLFFAGICLASLIGFGIVLLANSFYLHKAQQATSHTTITDVGRSVKALVMSIIIFIAITSVLPWMTKL